MAAVRGGSEGEGDSIVKRSAAGVDPVEGEEGVCLGGDPLVGAGNIASGLA